MKSIIVVKGIKMLPESRELNVFCLAAVSFFCSQPVFVFFLPPVFFLPQVPAVVTLSLSLSLWGEDPYLMTQQ